MTTMTNPVRARNLCVGDEIEMDSMPHTVTDLTFHQDETVTVYGKHTEPRNSYAGFDTFGADEEVVVLIDA